MSFTHGSPRPQEQYTEDTLFKVYDALREGAGLTEKQTRLCIDVMRQRGILFRELVEQPANNGYTIRDNAKRVRGFEGIVTGGTRSPSEEESHVVALDTERPSS